MTYTSCRNVELTIATRPRGLVDRDIRLTNNLDVFLAVRRIKLRKLVGIHRLYRLQGVLLQRFPDARNLHHFVKTSRALEPGGPHADGPGLPISID
jgi:hypothetical protein